MVSYLVACTALLRGKYSSVNPCFKTPNASKIAFVHLVKQLERWGFGMIDCQMKTIHLASLGAREITRIEFAQKLKQLVTSPNQDQKWHFDYVWRK